MKKRKNKKIQGFTLVEVLVVVAIIGVLTTISAFTFSGYVKDSQEAITRQELSQIVMMVRVAKQQKKQYFLPDNDSFIVTFYSDLDDECNMEALYNTDSGLEYQSSMALDLICFEDNDEFALTYTNHGITMYYDSRDNSYSLTEPVETPGI